MRVEEIEVPFSRLNYPTTLKYAHEMRDWRIHHIDETVIMSHLIIELVGLSTIYL